MTEIESVSGGYDGGEGGGYGDYGVSTGGYGYDSVGGGGISASLGGFIIEGAKAVGWGLVTEAAKAALIGAYNALPAGPYGPDGTANVNAGVDYSYGQAPQDGYGVDGTPSRQ